MADVTMGEAAGASRDAGRRASSWVSALPGVVFFVAFLASFFLFNQPNDDASNKEWLTYYADRSHRIAILISGYLFIVAGLALVFFFVRLHERVRSTGPGEHRDATPIVLAGVAGSLMALGGLVQGTIPGGTIFGNLPIPTDADILRLTTDMGFVLPGVGGMLAAGVAIFTITRQAQRSGYFGRAMTIFSYVAAVAGVAGALFFPIAIVLIWVIAVSVVLARRPAVA